MAGPCHGPEKKGQDALRVFLRLRFAAPPDHPECVSQAEPLLQTDCCTTRTDAPCPGSEINEHKGVSRVSGKPGGKRTKFVLMVKAGRPAGVGSMNRVHLSRRACACVGSNVQAGTWQHENERLYPPKNLASSVDWSSNFFGLLRRNLARFCIFHFKAGNSWRCAKGMRLHSGSSLTSPSRNSL